MDIQVEDIQQRLERRLSRRFNKPTALPLGLHCYPKGNHADGERWFGIGPVNWGVGSESWWDIFISKEDDYHRVNNMLATACNNLGLGYICLT